MNASKKYTNHKSSRIDLAARRNLWTGLHCFAINTGGRPKRRCAAPEPRYAGACKMAFDCAAGKDGRDHFPASEIVSGVTQ